MFKYTADPEVLRKYDSISRNAKRPWDDHFFLARSITKTADAYFACGNFWRNYKNCQFFSKTRVKEVPVNGVMISVDWFTETKV
jgi:hypothetical protein